MEHPEISYFGKIAAAVKKVPPQVFLCLIILAVMFPVLKNGFVNWDDADYIIENPALRGSWLDALTCFLGYYHPLTILTYKAEFVLFGLNPFPYHLTSLVLHLIGSVSAFYLFLAFGAGKRSAFIGALLFGIHPVHVEPVAWISGRKELLWGIFSFWTFICYFRFIDTRLNKYAVCSLLFFVLAVLSKPFALVIPFAILLIDHYRARTVNAELLMEKILYLMIALPLFLLSYAPSGFLMRGESRGGFAFFSGAASSCKSVAFYVQKFILPSKLSALYPAIKVSGDPAEYVFILLAAIISVSALGWRLRRSLSLSRPSAERPAVQSPGGDRTPGPCRKTVLGAGFFLITVFPALLLSTPADRYDYVPAAGFCFLYGELISWLYGIASERAVLSLKRAFSALVIVHLFVLSAASVLRVAVWKDSMTLWNDAVNKYPLEHLPYYERGNTYAAAGEYGLALADYTRSIARFPGFWKAWNHRGAAFARMKELDKAIANYGMGLRINPSSAELFLNRSRAYALKGDYARAAEDYNRAVALRRPPRKH